MVNTFWFNLMKSQKNSTVNALRSCYIFEHLSYTELKIVSQFCHTRTYKIQEAIFNQGEVGIGMYIILKGSVDIFTEEPGNTEPILVGRWKPDDFMGEIALIEGGSPRTATALASEETTVVGFFKPDLDQIAKRHPALGMKIIDRVSKTIAKRLRETVKNLDEIKKELKL